MQVLEALLTQRLSGVLALLKNTNAVLRVRLYGFRSGDTAMVLQLLLLLLLPSCCCRRAAVDCGTALIKSQYRRSRRGNEIPSCSVLCVGSNGVWRVSDNTFHVRMEHFACAPLWDIDERPAASCAIRP
jgi:hypothetical protein